MRHNHMRGTAGHKAIEGPRPRLVGYQVRHQPVVVRVGEYAGRLNARRYRRRAGEENRLLPLGEEHDVVLETLQAGAVTSV
jgi:hypothetical protein